MPNLARQRSIAWAWLIFSSCISCTTPPGARPQHLAPPPSAEGEPPAVVPADTLANIGIAQRKVAIRGRLDALARETFAFWLKHGPDVIHGGFHGKLDRYGRPIPKANKGLVQQARHLWTLSMWYRLREADPSIEAQANSLFDFLSLKFYDSSNAEFHFTVSDSGHPVERRKVLYGQSFAIYALSEYARAFEVKRAWELALSEEGELAFLLLHPMGS